MAGKQLRDRFPDIPGYLFESSDQTVLKRNYVAFRWFSLHKSLNTAAREYIREHLPPVGVRAFDETSESYWQQIFSDDTLDNLAGLVLVTAQSGEIVAWVANSQFRVGNRRVFYAFSAGVNPDHQGLGFSSRIWRMLLMPTLFAAPHRSLYVTMRVGNPLVYSAWAAGATRATDVYPRPGLASLPVDIQQVAIAVADRIGQKQQLESETLVIRDAYGFSEKGLWKQRPTTDWEEIGTWMTDLLSVRDAIIMVVVFSPFKMAINEVARQLARRLGLRNKHSSRTEA